MAMRRWRTPQQCVRPRLRRPPSPPPAVRFCGTRGRASRRASSKTGRSTSSATRFRTHLQRSVTRPSLARLRTPRRWASPLLPTCPRRGPISRAIRLEQTGRLTMRVALYLPLDSWRAVAETVSRSGRGDDWVEIGGVKGYMDGSAGSRTAYFFEPYSDSAGYNGLLQHSEADMRSWIGSADPAGLQVAVHAIGDRANAVLLSIYDSVTKAHGPRDRRFRVEHAQHLRP